MHAWLCTNPVGVEALAWTEMPTPEPKANEVRIAIRCASLNFPDLLIVEGKYQMKPPLPFVPGAEYAGVTQYMASHPMPAPPHGMRGGILISSVSKGYVCLGWCHTWRGLVVMPDGFTEVLHSDQGSNGMQDYVTPGDYFWFPASGPVDAPGDNTGARPAKVIVRGAVTP